MSNKKLLLQIIVDEDDNIGIAYGEEAEKIDLRMFVLRSKK